MDFPTHSELKEIWARQKAEGESVRMLSDDGERPEAGHFYTVSADFSRGDRSWVGKFWEVLSVSGPQAFVRIHESKVRTVEMFFAIGERAWYNADEAWKLSSKGETE